MSEQAIFLVLVALGEAPKSLQTPVMKHQYTPQSSDNQNLMTTTYQRASINLNYLESTTRFRDG
jgi:hypothetical protein